MTTKQKHKPTPWRDRLSETTIYEAYFDLWGFTMPWIDAISNALHEYCECATDESEAYQCMACMAHRFRSTKKERVEEAKRIFARLAALANHAAKGAPGEVVYVNA